MPCSLISIDLSVFRKKPQQCEVRNSLARFKVSYLPAPLPCFMIIGGKPAQLKWHSRVKSLAEQGGLTFEELGVVYSLRSRDDLLSSNEDIIRIAVPLVLRVWHCVEWPDLHHSAVASNYLPGPGTYTGQSLTE
jgi:hypothetical protein